MLLKQCISRLLLLLESISGNEKITLLHHFHDGYGNNKTLGLMTFVNSSQKSLLSYNYDYSVTLMLVTDVGDEMCW